MKLGLAICALLVTNLLVPQRALVYSACCYDESGALSSECIRKPAPKSATLRPRTCCAVKSVDLKPGVLLAASSAKDRPVTLELIDGPISIALDSRSQDSCDAVWADSTGPPQPISLTTLHSRLNL